MENIPEKLKNNENLPIENIEVLNDELLLIKGGKGTLTQDEIEADTPAGIGCNCGCS